MKITFGSGDVSTECSVSIYDVINGTPEFNSFIDEFTKIYCNAPSGETFFNHKSCILILENIAFYNVKKDSNGNFTRTEAKKNIFMQHSIYGL